MTVDNILNKINKLMPVKWRWVLESAGFRKYFKNTGWMFFGQIFSLLISFFVGAWMARYLGPENYGILNYALAFVGIFAFIASLGVDGILNRDLINFPEKRDELLGTAFKLKLWGGVFTFLLVVIIIFITEKSPLIRALVVLYSSIFIFQAINSVVSIFFQAKVKAKNNVLAIILSAIISAVFKVVIILSHQGVIWLMLVFVLEVIFQGLVLVNTYRRESLKIKTWRFDRGLAKTMLSSSWLLMLSSASTYIYLKIDQIMIGNILNKTDLGLYSVAVKLSDVWYFIPGVICGSLFPAIANARKVDLKLYKERLSRLYFLLGGVAIFISAFLAIIAPWLINFLFGEQYLAAAGIVRIYIWSGVGMFVSAAIGNYLLLENKLKAIFYFNFFPMLVNIGLNLIFIPRFGLAGAAWATLISYSVGPLTFYIFKKKTVPLKIQN